MWNLATAGSVVTGCITVRKITAMCFSVRGIIFQQQRHMVAISLVVILGGGSLRRLGICHHLRWKESIVMVSIL